jgi:hypothetical protein
VGRGGQGVKVGREGKGGEGNGKRGPGWLQFIDFLTQKIITQKIM